MFGVLAWMGIGRTPFVAAALKELAMDEGIKSKEVIVLVSF